MIRVLVVAGALIFFMDCAGRVKPWKFQDNPALDVRILDVQQWSESVTRSMNDLDKIMKREIRYYLDRDMRIYDRIEPNHEAMRISITEVDSVIDNIVSLCDLLKASPGDSLDSVPDDSSSSYRDIIESTSKDIKVAKKAYYRGLKKLKKGFRKDRRKLIFIEDEHAHYKKTLYDIKYKREELDSGLERFNKILNRAIFEDAGSSYSRHVRMMSKRFESYESKLDVFEEFLSDIDIIAHDEAGGYVIITTSKTKPMKFMVKYDEGLEEYLDTIEDIRKALETI